MGRFAGKRVLITGASKGLGLVAARAFAVEGAEVILSGRNVDALYAAIASLPGLPPGHEDVLHWAADLTDMQQVDSFAAMVGETGGADIILHAMGGGYGWQDPLLPAHQAETLWRVNLGAAMELNRMLIPRMQERGWGRVIHIGSTASTEACGSVGYNTVKAALAGYVRSVGRVMAGSGVVVSAVLPGAFAAPGNAFERRTPEQVAEFVARRLPRGRVGTAEELLPLIMLLASDGASMMAGSCIQIDAGEGAAYAI